MSLCLFLSFVLPFLDAKASAQGEIYELMRHVESSAKALQSLTEQLSADSAKGKECLSTQVMLVESLSNSVGYLCMVKVHAKQLKAKEDKADSRCST